MPTVIRLVGVFDGLGWVDQWPAATPDARTARGRSHHNHVVALRLHAQASDSSVLNQISKRPLRGHARFSVRHGIRGVDEGDREARKHAKHGDHDC